jgi:glutamate formiminotransferase
VSEGRDPVVLAALADTAGPYLLDVHADPDHHRSVFTLAGQAAALMEATRAFATAVVKRIDLRHHEGAHPRFGALDVVPWVALSIWPLRPAPVALAVERRDEFARWVGLNLDLPCFLYGPERSLPEVRRTAWSSCWPDAGPRTPHPTAGAVAVGARPPLVAYNLWLADADLVKARVIAAGLRGPSVRALGLAVGDSVQVSCNLTDPQRVGPAAVFDAVANQAAIARAELVGLLPGAVLDAIPSHRWSELDLERSRTIEARLQKAGLNGGR